MTLIDEDKIRDAVLSGRTFAACIEDEERRLIHATIEACGGNKSAAAGVLGISREGLYKKMHRLGIG